MKKLLFLTLMLFTVGIGISEAQTKPHYAQIKGKPVFYAQDYGAPADGSTDATTQINACILAAVQAQDNPGIPYGTTNSSIVLLQPSKNYYVGGTIYVPSGIILDMNGSRLLGSYDTPTATRVYSASDVAVIETGMYNGTAIVSNATTTAELQRVVKSSIRNGTIYNAQCAMRLYNFQEQSKVKDVTCEYVARAAETSNCFFSTWDNVVVRDSCKAVGQVAINMSNACNAIVFSKCVFSGCAIGIALSGTTNLAISINNCDFEGAYLTNGVGLVDGIGILVQGPSQAIKITNNYFEGIRDAMVFNSSIEGGSISDNYSTECEYAILSTVNSMLGVSLFGNSFPDGGGIVRNLVDVSPLGNSVFVISPGKTASTASGTSAYPLNVSTCPQTTFAGDSIWLDNARTSDIARSFPSIARNSKLTPMPYEGRELVTTVNQIPFVTITDASTTVDITTSLVWDDSQMIAFNLTVSDYVGGPYKLRGTVYGDTIYWLASDSTYAQTTVASVANMVTFTLSNMATNGGTALTTSGQIRHH